MRHHTCWWRVEAPDIAAESVLAPTAEQAVIAKQIDVRELRATVTREVGDRPEPLP